MNEMEYREQFNNMMAQIADLPEELRAELQDLAAETESRHRSLSGYRKKFNDELSKVEIVTMPAAGSTSKTSMN